VKEVFAETLSWGGLVVLVEWVWLRGIGLSFFFLIFIEGDNDFSCGGMLGAFFLAVVKAFLFHFLIILELESYGREGEW
jgi:hypothetical protein